MAIQSSFYLVDGSTRTFPSTKPIATKQHCAVYVKDIALLTWSVVPVGDYSLITNSIVFDTAPASALYSEIEIRVVDTQGEIVDSPSDIALVAGSITNVNTVATNIASVNTTATNIASINSVSSTVVPNIAEILLADDNATTATTQAGIATAQAVIATTQAGLSSDSAIEAEHWANYTTDVAVPEGTGEFSAKHYATKAAQSLAGLTIDATPTDGSSNAVSSNGVFDALAGKSDTSHTHATYLALAGGTMTGAITALRETKVAMGANDIDLSAGNLFTKTISGATTLTVSNWLASGNANSFILELTNGGSAVVTYPAGSKFAGGTAFTLTASGKDILGCYSHDGGTTLNWILLAKDVK